MSLTGLLFLLFYAVTAAMCLFRHPVFGLYGYIIIFYLDAPNRWWGATLPSFRWSFFIALLTLLSIYIHKAKLQRPWPVFQTPFVLLIIYVLWMYIQSGWAIDLYEHAQGLNFFTKYLIVVYLVVRLIDSREKIAGFFLANAIGGLYLGYLAWQSGGGGRLNGIGGPGIDDANSLGMQMSVIAFFCAGLFFTQKTRVKWFSALSVAFVLNTLVMAGSRGAFLAFVCGGVTFFLFRPKGQIGRLAVIGAIGLVGFASVASEYFWERMTSIQDAAAQTEEIDKSAASRFVIIASQWEMAKHHPLGGGHKTTAALSEQYIPIEYHAAQGGRSSHNTIMSSLVDQGIPGLILWLLLLWSLVRRNTKLRRHYIRTGDTQTGYFVAATIAGIGIVTVAGLFAPYIRAEVYIWLIGLTCAMIAMSRSEAAQATEIAPAQEAPPVPEEVGATP